MANVSTVLRTVHFIPVLAVFFISLHASFAWGAASPPTPGVDPLENGWKAFIAGHALVPQRLVAVDKNRQLLFLFERQSPLRIAEQYVCTTGRALGDKRTEGDLKTPEGIYFVVRHVDSGLDYIKYGNEAYTLNYPNPVDKIRRKTGYGIWIHGRGEPIQPRVTEGCVSLNNGDIAVLGKNLEAGAPVALASSVVHAQNYSSLDARMLTLLEEKIHAWNRAWAARSASLFDFYDQEAYSIANEPFSDFRAQKERLFTVLPWIDTTIRDVHVLQGPGYWVTWFFQNYKAPNLSTTGVRRLYWQPDSSGELRIVGMEWLPHLTGTLLASRSDTLPGSDASEVPIAEGGQVPALSGPTQPTALSEATPTAPVTAPAPVFSPAEELATQTARFVERWRNAWENGDLDAYMAHYAADAKQGNRNGAAAIEAHKRANWKKKPPVLVELSNTRISVNGDTVTADMLQEYEDSSGYKDMGIKTLIIRRTGPDLEIVQEEWVTE